MRIAIVIDQDLQPGLAANAAAALAFSLSGRVAGQNGPDVVDADGGLHPGILTVPIPVLKAEAAALAGLRAKAEAAEGVSVLGFSAIAQAARDYGDYAARLAASRSGEIAYRGLCLYGEDRAVRSLTGAFPLYK